MTASSYKQFFRLHREVLVIGVAIVLVALFVIISRGLWASPYNLASVLQVTATLGISNLTDEEPAKVGWGLPNQRGNRVVGAGYDQVGQSVFLAATYKF